MQRSMKTFPVVLLAVLFLLSTVTTGCTGNSAQANHSFELALLAEMPDEVQQAPIAVQEAYQFAVANPDVLAQIPCYCGCGGMGHTSNYGCFVSGETNDGTIAFENHALGCSICVDIAQDTMRLLDEGQTVEEIFTYVNNNYSRFGPPTPLNQ